MVCRGRDVTASIEAKEECSHCGGIAYKVNRNLLCGVRGSKRLLGKGG
jgi:hypothetical protein